MLTNKILKKSLSKVVSVTMVLVLIFALSPIGVYAAGVTLSSV